MIVARDLHLYDAVIPAGTPVRLATNAERAGEADTIAEMIAAGQVAAYVVEGYGVRYLGEGAVQPALPPGMWSCACGGRSSTSHRYCRTCAQPRPTPYAETTTPLVSAAPDATLTTVASVLCGTTL